jgi:hypothetical protein
MYLMHFQPFSELTPKQIYIYIERERFDPYKINIRVTPPTLSIYLSVCWERALLVPAVIKKSDQDSWGEIGKGVIQ